MKICAILLAIILANAEKYVGPTNQAGLNLIKEFEGFRPNFYKDPVGIKTIGYGHACHASSCTVPINGKYPVPLSKEDGQKLLQDDLKAPGRYEDCVRNAVTYSNLNANQYSALVSFTFNLGCGALKGSELLKKLNRGDVLGSSREFAKWVHAGGKVLPGLVRRREAERKLFCSDGVCGGGGGGGGHTAGENVCKGTVDATSPKIRSAPSTSAKVTGSLASGATVTITGRTTGTNVSGNSHWFKVPNGYVSAFYINISSNNGADYCKKD